MSDNEIINMTNKYTNELMNNLLNDYFFAFEQLIEILKNDFIDNNKNYGIVNIVFFCISMVVSLIYIIFFWKMMTKLDNDREKPVNLFLTIKKKVFEDLKNSAENFSNKLLNKFFGNEEIEEEFQQEYRTNIKANDINIAKFKALNEYKASINKKSSFLFYFIQIIILFILFNLYILFIYLNTKVYARNVSKYTNIYSETQFSHIYLIARLGAIKQYFFNNSIYSFKYSRKNIFDIFLFCFRYTSNNFGYAIQLSSQMDAFLNQEYRAFFTKYLYHDYFDQTILDVYEVLRFISIRYFMDNSRNGFTSDLIYENRWNELNEIIIYLIRPWFNNILNKLESAFYNLVEKRKINYLSIYLIFAFIISVYYWNGWKKYEVNFINLIKKSFDLINLIPEEIKNIIVLKLNE